MLKMETSRYNLYESESSCSMNVNEMTMSLYKPFEVTRLQDKSKFITYDRAMSQYVSLEQGQSHPSTFKMKIPI